MPVRAAQGPQDFCARKRSAGKKKKKSGEQRPPHGEATSHAWATLPLRGRGARAAQEVADNENGNTSFQRQTHLSYANMDHYGPQDVEEYKHFVRIPVNFFLAPFWANPRSQCRAWQEALVQGNPAAGSGSPRPFWCCPRWLVVGGDVESLRMPAACMWRSYPTAISYDFHCVVSGR